MGLIKSIQKFKADYDAEMQSYHERAASHGSNSTTTATWTADNLETKVVGTSEYQKQLGIVSAIIDRDGEIEAVLQREPNNQFDENAVQIFAEGHLIGYLPRAVAGAWQGQLKKWEKEGRQVRVGLMVYGGDNGKKFGCVVALPESPAGL